MYKIISNDLSAFVYGRKILKQSPQASIEFILQDGTKQSNTSEQFWNTALSDIAKNQTRFGRVGLIYDRKNKIAKNFVESFNFEALEYKAQEERAHTEKKLRITILETQILTEIANEGFADSVEFRRLARKQLRPLRHANIDTIFFFEDILSEEKTRKILSTIIGGQRKLMFPIDYFTPEIQETNKRKIEIISDTEDELFLKNRAEQILKTQISSK